MEQMARDKLRPEVVFLDPPRSGSDERFLRSLLKCAPERVVYVSCDPETLARDLGVLTEGGYAVRRIQPVDMFPYTEHVETVVLMSRP
jgi:23S rRNA (uracil1939-C5)-methyltransferase